MSTNGSVHSAFAKRVSADSDAPALIFPELTFNYGKLDSLALSFCSCMQQAGVRQTSTIAVQSSDPLVVIAALLATSRLGAAIVQDNEGINLPPELLITHNFHTVEPERTPAPGSILIDATWSPAHNTDVKVAVEINPEAPWLYVHTSGTTGLPKFLAWSQRMVCDRSKAVAGEYVAGKTRAASLMPMNSRPFIARALAALMNGATIVDGKDIEFWRRAGVTMVSGSVAQMLGVFGTRSLGEKFPLAEVFGSRLQKSGAEKLLRNFEIIQDVFGASEASKLFANVSKLDADGSMVTYGQRLDSIIELVGADDKLVADGAMGIVRIKNHYLASAYVGDDDASRSAFKDGWFYPGDLATWGENGRLQIENRNDSVLNIGGVKINALIVDQVARSTPGVRDAICFKSPKSNVSDQLFVFVVLEKGTNPLQVTEAVRQHCQTKLGQFMTPHVVRSVGGIPRNTEGVPDRRACADLILRLDQMRAIGNV